MLRNGWPASSGIAGRNQSEWVAGFVRNRRPESSGIRRYQGIVENFVEEDENGEFNYVCPDCDSPKIVEAKLKASWQKSFAGRKIDLEKALASGWHDQGSEKFLYGVKQQKNIWAKIVKPAQQSCHEI